MHVSVRHRVYTGTRMTERFAFKERGYVRERMSGKRETYEDNTSATWPTYARLLPSLVLIAGIST